jgi:hypothetical protein
VYLNANFSTAIQGSIKVEKLFLPQTFWQLGNTHTFYRKKFQDLPTL